MRQATSPLRELDHALVEIDRLSQQLEGLKKELAWSHRLATLGSMSAVLAHEYNNLLTPITSYAQLALNNPDDPELARKAHQVVIDCVRKVRTLSQATLGFVRREQDEEPESTTIPDALNATLITLGQALEHENIDLQVDLPSTPVEICGLHLQQVLVNLLDNARKAMLGEPQPRILQIRGHEQQGGVLVSVSDTGPGFPKSLQNSAFDAFVTQTTSQQSPPGTGLGLSICRDLIAGAAGWIELDSSMQDNASDPIKRGACIRFWLPTATLSV